MKFRSTVLITHIFLHNSSVISAQSVITGYVIDIYYCCYYWCIKYYIFDYVKRVVSFQPLLTSQDFKTTTTGWDVRFSFCVACYSTVFSLSKIIWFPSHQNLKHRECQNVCYFTSEASDWEKKNTSWINFSSMIFYLVVSFEPSTHLNPPSVTQINASLSRAEIFTDELL